MHLSKFVKTSTLSALASLCLVAVPAAFSQEHGAIPTPDARPKVDQLGQMKGLPMVDRTALGIALFLQVATSVGVAIALAGWWSMPPKRKPQ